MEQSGNIRKGWTTGYFTVPDSIFEAQISPNAKLVYMYLCRRADSNGQSYPGYGRTAQDTGLSRRTVIRAIAELIEHGLIEKDFRGKKETGEYWHNEYTIIHPNDAIPKKGGDSVTLGSDSVTLGSDSVTLGSDSVTLGSDSVTPEGQQSKDNNLRTTPKDNNKEPVVVSEEILSHPLFSDLPPEETKAALETIMKKDGISEADLRKAIDYTFAQQPQKNLFGYLRTCARHRYWEHTFTKKDKDILQKNNEKYAAFYRLYQK